MMSHRFFGDCKDNFTRFLGNNIEQSVGESGNIHLFSQSNMYLSSAIFRLWKHIFCTSSVKCSFNWEDMGTFSFVCSLVYLAPDVWVTALCQASKLLRSMQRWVELSLCLLIKAMLWRIEIAVECGGRSPWVHVNVHRKVFRGLKARGSPSLDWNTWLELEEEEEGSD